MGILVGGRDRMAALTIFTRVWNSFRCSETAPYPTIEVFAGKKDPGPGRQCTKKLDTSKHSPPFLFQHSSSLISHPSSTVHRKPHMRHRCNTIQTTLPRRRARPPVPDSGLLAQRPQKRSQFEVLGRLDADFWERAGGAGATVQ
jgi:hypothetical protein